MGLIEIAHVVHCVFMCVLYLAVPAHDRYDKDWKGGSIRVLRPTCAINHRHLIL